MHQQGPGDITSQGGRRPLSRCSCRPSTPPQGTDQDREAAGATASLPYRRGFLSPACASGKEHRPPTPGVLPSRFRGRLLLALAEACPLRNLGPRAGIPAPSGGAEAGAGQRLEPGVRVWRGAELSAPILPTLRSLPTARRPRAQRKMAARSAADSHVPRRYRRTPPPPLAESRTPRDAQP